MQLLLERRQAPLGTLLLVADEAGVLRALEFAEHEPRMHRLLRRHYATCTLRENSVAAHITQALDAYFGGEFNALMALTVTTGGTTFQRAVWKGLRTIPAGTTISYAQLAARVGRPTASRAVGAANGANPIAIVVPCHRVIGANGALTGYAGGMAHKKWLLDHERQSGLLRACA